MLFGICSFIAFYLGILIANCLIPYRSKSQKKFLARTKEGSSIIESFVGLMIFLASIPLIEIILKSRQCPYAWFSYCGIFCVYYISVVLFASIVMSFAVFFINKKNRDWTWFSFSSIFKTGELCLCYTFYRLVLVMNFENPILTGILILNLVVLIAIFVVTFGSIGSILSIIACK